MRRAIGSSSSAHFGSNSSIRSLNTWIRSKVNAAIHFRHDEIAGKQITLDDGDRKFRSQVTWPDKRVDFVSVADELPGDV